MLPSHDTMLQIHGPAGVRGSAAGGGATAEELKTIANAHYPLLGLAGMLWAYPRSPGRALTLQWLVVAGQFAVGIARQDWITFGVRFCWAVFFRP